MSEFTLDVANTRIAWAKQQAAMAGHAIECCALEMAQMVIQLLTAEVARLTPPPPAVESPPVEAPPP